MTATFVSTSIPYVNAPPHVGFALELVQADVIARRRRQRGEDVFFLSGTDENALKNVQVAEELGITPAQLCDRNAPRFGELIRALHISTDGFIRTSSDQHHLGVQKLWQACRPEDFARRALLHRVRGLLSGERSARREVSDPRLVSRSSE